MDPKTVNTAEYICGLRELTEQGQEVRLRIAGNSMVPFLRHERDSVAFRKPDRPLRPGDVVLYQRLGGQFVCHRIAKVTKAGFFLVGDSQLELEGPIRREQIFGIVTRVWRKGKPCGPHSPVWLFYRWIWGRTLPLRPVIFKVARLLKRIRRIGT